MPGKSRHKKGKHYRPRQGRPAIGSTGATKATTAVTAETPAKSPSPAPETAPKPMAAPAKSEAMPAYPYIGSDLRHIGLLTVVVLVILIVLSLILK